jgi:hypothetical protein
VYIFIKGNQMIGKIVKVSCKSGEYLVHITKINDCCIRGDYYYPKTNYSSRGEGVFCWSLIKDIQTIDPTPEQKQLFPHLREKFPKWFKSKNRNNIIIYLRFDSMDSMAVRFDKWGNASVSDCPNVQYRNFDSTYWQEVDTEPDVIKNHEKEKWYLSLSVDNFNDSRYWEPTDKPQVVIDYDGQLWYKRNVVEGTVPKYISVIAGGQTGWDSCGQMIGTYIGKEKWNIEDKNLWTQIFKPECIKC